MEGDSRMGSEITLERVDLEMVACARGERSTLSPAAYVHMVVRHTIAL